MIRVRLVAFSLLAVVTSGAVSAGISDRLTEVLSAIPPAAIGTGILYDRVLPLAEVAQYDGSADAPAITRSQWRQAYSEMRRASNDPSGWPTWEELTEQDDSRGEAIALTLVDLAYQRIRDDALASGALVAQGNRWVLGSNQAFETKSFCSAAPTRDRTYRGERVLFHIDRRSFFTNRVDAGSPVAIDCADGRGFRAIEFGQDVVAAYASTGSKTIRLRLRDLEGVERTAAFQFEVEALGTPTPDDTLHITASIRYGGVAGTAEAYVYLAPEHSVLTNPVIVIEGFDLDNSLDWDGLYALLNQENLLEDLRTLGYDAVVVNFTDAVTFIQRNAFTVVETLQQVEALIEPGTTVAVAGASMGGLCGRYALAYMENQGIGHEVRTFISFDAPQSGANIPLGIQYWLYFFASESTEAAQLLALLNAPAARQMLVYHYTDPPSPTGSADLLRNQLENDLLSLGDYPSEPHLVAVANGSSQQINQGFNPGAQIIDWTYRSFLVDIDGNVWAVPDGNNHLIFEGMINIFLLPTEELNVSVIGTSPYDNSPGGSRNTMQQMADVPAPYGDIIALHNDHSFIPTISALDLDTDDLFYDVAGDPDPASHSPFDALYFPIGNQEHIFISPETKGWLIAEITAVPAGVGEEAFDPEAVARLSIPYPNPVTKSARIGFDLSRSSDIRLAIFDSAGRQVATLAEGRFPAGPHEVEWAVEEARAAGVYFVRLRGAGIEQARALVVR